MSNQENVSKYYQDDLKLGGASLASLNSEAATKIQVPIEDWIYE